MELAKLREAMTSLERAPYLLTVGDDRRAHCVATPCRWRGDELELEVGNRTLANAAVHPAVSLLWPPNEADGYSLIVDAEVTSTEGSGAGDNIVRARPSAAVLPRPAAGGPVTEGCTADCVPLLDRATGD